MENKNPPTLVLLSGLLCNDFVWQDVCSELKDQFDIHIFSFAGFSSFESMAQHVLDNSPDVFALAGHSMGGRVALQIINQAPERISHLALLNTGVHPKKDSEVPGRQKLLDLADSEGMEAVAESWLPPMMSEKGKNNHQLMDDLRSMITSHSPSDFHGQINALLNRPDALPFLKKVNVHTLLLSGEEDNWSPIEQHEAMQAHLDSSELVGLTGIGHMSTVEAPKEIARAIRQWLK